VLDILPCSYATTWSTFDIHGETVFQGLFARRRMFLLTEGPHLYYVDPVNKVLKGQIPWYGLTHLYLFFTKFNKGPI